MNNVFALYRDDADKEEVKQLISIEREKAKVKDEKKEKEAQKEMLKFKEGPAVKKTVLPPSVEPAKEISSDITKEVTLALILIIIAVIFGKKLYVQFKKSK